MKKNLLTTLAAFAVATFTAFAADETPVTFTDADGNYTYVVNDDGETVTLTAANNITADMVVPETVDNDGTTYTVTAIGEKAFNMKFALKTMKLPDTVKRIERTAFEYSLYLTDINMPTQLEYIGYAAFSNTKLTRVVLPETFAQSDGNAFFGVSTLTEVYILATEPVTANVRDFDNCSALKNIYVKKSALPHFQSATGWSARASQFTADIPVQLTDEYTTYTAADFDVDFSDNDDLKVYAVGDGSTLDTDDLKEITTKYVEKGTTVVLKGEGSVVAHIGEGAPEEPADDPSDDPAEDAAVHGVSAGIQGASAPAYSLHGQRVGNSYKGIVIQNGKKRIQR